MLTSIQYRMDAYETIGGLFKDLKQGYIENKLNIKVLAVVYLIKDVLENIIKSMDIEYITSKITTNIEDFGFIANTHKLKHQDVT